MMTEQELNNLMREKAQTNIPSIVQEIMRLTQELEQKARELQSLHAGMSKGGQRLKPLRRERSDLRSGNTGSEIRVARFACSWPQGGIRSPCN